jgi:hypothetical protein
LNIVRKAQDAIKYAAAAPSSARPQQVSGAQPAIKLRIATTKKISTAIDTAMDFVFDK